MSDTPQEMEARRLLPCPLCSSTFVEMHHMPAKYVVCGDCGCMAPFTKWNTRAGQQWEGPAYESGVTGGPESVAALGTGAGGGEEVERLGGLIVKGAPDRVKLPSGVYLEGEGETAYIDLYRATVAALGRASKALEPFAKFAEIWHKDVGDDTLINQTDEGVCLRLSDFRNALAVLQGRALPTPDRAVEEALIWLRAALDCKEFGWSEDQREAAEYAYAAAFKTSGQDVKS